MLPVLVLGAGPAGLAAAYRISNASIPVLLVEKDPEYVGGISRTVDWGGYRFDIGGHRFYTKSKEVQAFWSTILGEDLLVRKRLSRILYRETYFSYPLDMGEVLRKLHPLYSARCLASYLRAKLFPRADISNYENWMVNTFGEALFETFFRSYTEKVWGIPCSKISSDWAAQRTKGVNFVSIVRRNFFDRVNSQHGRSLINEFLYPRLGAGQMWSSTAERIKAHGGEIAMGMQPRAIRVQPGGFGVELSDSSGNVRVVEVEKIVSSIPIGALLSMLNPPPPDEVLEAVSTLRHRDFILVALKIKKPSLFPDHWIYVHDPRVMMGRVQDFRNWSPALIPNESHGLVGLEYFTFEDSPFWSMSDVSILAQAITEAETVGIVSRDLVEDGIVVRVPKAYPIYENGYKRCLDTVHDFINSTLPSLQLIGRNGIHRYNNMDHSVMTGFLAAQNVIEGSRQYSPWLVNEDAAYLEEN